jgi:uncharacterized protein YyaL (SSP411 family)/aryl-alcohol dehydrogenase-like predicted oxidoreductase
VSQTPSAGPANRLADETSPYLLQHAHNPVDWYPWGAEALTRARDEDRLILLSIGYSACHWCHVMERESFENPEIASLMNEHFVNVKVDREERPDLDDIYMAATVALNAGNGGWPMTVFLTPDLEPVFAGTYFAPTDAGGRPGFPRVLEQIANAWASDQDSMKESAGKITRALVDQRALAGSLNVGIGELQRAAESYAEDFDQEYGGFGAAPKFPPAVGLMLLLRLHNRFKDPHHLEMVIRTLDAMADGGIYDHLAGGFARYSTDRHWLAPHFEKMLYDNALLTRAYLEAFQVTGNENYRRVATETLDYVIRGMTDANGGFYSSTDADSEGVEGKFFVWSPEEVVEILGEEDAKVFNAFYDVSSEGNWEGTNILHTPRTVVDLAKRFDLETSEAESRIKSMRLRMYEAREKRVKPGLDDKILTAWNGLMISALAEGYRILGDDRYRDAALRATGFLMKTHRDDQGRLLRTSRAGRAHLQAYLEDYACLAEGLVDLYEVTGDESLIEGVGQLCERMVGDFGDADSGAFYNTGVDHESLLMRFRDGSDGATPSPNAVAASALVRAGRLLDRADFKEAAVKALMAYGPFMQRFARGFAKSLIVVDSLLDAPIELALVGTDGPELEAFRAALGRTFLPNRVQVIGDGSGKGSTPLLEGKTVATGAALFICRDYTCEVPVTDAALVAERLAAHQIGSVSPTIAVRRPGFATPEGTARFKSRFAPTGFTTLAATGITVSKLGFGGYRTDDVTPDHREALVRSLASGVNLVDTSTNYMDGASERMIGSVLNDLVTSGEMLRDEVVLVSKIGYVQGSNFDMVKARDEAGDPFPEVTRIGDGLWHCIHPDFLADQLQRSMDRLGVETLDVCLLHNPEYFLSYGGGDNPINEIQDEFYRRIREAFQFFEEQVKTGRLQWYGVSSNTVAGRPDDKQATSLHRILAAAQEAGGDDHHCKVLQLPLNLFESNAALPLLDEPAVVDLAKESGVAVLANRPLNAFVEREMVRLTDFVTAEGSIDTVAALRVLTALENRYRQEIAARISAPKGALSPNDYFQWATQLELLMDQDIGIEQWAQIDHQIRSGVGNFVSVLDRNLQGEIHEKWSEWRDEYGTAVTALLHELRQRAVKHAAARSEAVSSAIDQLFEEHGDATLSRRALWTVASTPGVTSVLTGMRTPEYVADSVGILEWPPMNNPEEIYGAVRAAPYLKT